MEFAIIARPPGLVGPLDDLIQGLELDNGLHWPKDLLQISTGVFREHTSPLQGMQLATYRLDLNDKTFMRCNLRVVACQVDARLRI